MPSPDPPLTPPHSVNPSSVEFTSEVEALWSQSLPSLALSQRASPCRRDNQKNATVREWEAGGRGEAGPAPAQAPATGGREGGKEEGESWCVNEGCGQMGKRERDNGIAGQRTTRTPVEQSACLTLPRHPPPSPAPQSGAPPVWPPPHDCQRHSPILLLRLTALPRSASRRRDTPLNYPIPRTLPRSVPCPCSFLPRVPDCRALRFTRSLPFTFCCPHSSVGILLPLLLLCTCHLGQHAKLFCARKPISPPQLPSPCLTYSTENLSLRIHFFNVFSFVLFCICCSPFLRSW